MEHGYEVLYISLQYDSPTHVASLREKYAANISSANIYQALQMNLQEEFHLILLDGVESSLKYIQDACVKLGKRFQKPILVLVADLEEAQLVSLYDLGVEECIVGPHHIDLLAAKIRSWRRWSMARAAVLPRNQPSEGAHAGRTL